MEQRTANTVKLVGEVFVPGASQLIEGNVGSGAAHVVIGGLLVALIAPAAPLVAALVGLGVRLNSYSSSISGQNLWQQARGPAAQSTAAAAPETTRHKS